MGTKTFTSLRFSKIKYVQNINFNTVVDLILVVWVFSVGTSAKFGG